MRLVLVVVAPVTVVVAAGGARRADTAVVARSPVAAKQCSAFGQWSTKTSECAGAVSLRPVGFTGAVGETSDCIDDFIDLARGPGAIRPPSKNTLDPTGTGLATTRSAVGCFPGA